MSKCNFTESDFIAQPAHNEPTIILAGTTKFQVNIRIVDDEFLEDNELLRIVAIPPELPKDYNYCSADVIINDDDGKYKMFIVVNFIFYASKIFM